MRNQALAGLLFLCGSTAAIAQVVTPQDDPLLNNSMDNTTVDDAMTPTEPAPTQPTDPVTDPDATTDSTDPMTPPDGMTGKPPQ